MFVAQELDQIVGEYTITGKTVHSALISNSGNTPFDVMLDGNGHLFVTWTPTGTVGEYTTSGETVNDSLISGLAAPTGIVVIPEPSCEVLAAIGVLCLFPIKWRCCFQFQTRDA
jgi:hypothetical protein